MKTFSRGPWDIVVMGDSRVLRGVSPGAMEAALPGCRVFNFAYNSGSLTPEMLLHSPRFTPVYSTGGVWIFRINPPS